ncbi:hypothetical protein Trydic_g17551 [Trypoxylus dichotomus]
MPNLELYYAEVVRDELQELRVCVKKLTRIGKPEHPMFLLITDDKTGLKDTTSKARFLLRCKKFQTWGHATQNCYNNVTICVKCAGKHASYNCEKPRDTPARCCNCGLDHPASSTQCKVCLELLEDRRHQRERQQNTDEARRKPVHKPAPVLTKNIWEMPARRHQNDIPQQVLRYAVPPRNPLDKFPPLHTPRYPHEEFPPLSAPRPALLIHENRELAKRKPCC